MKHKLLHALVIPAALALWSCGESQPTRRYEFREDKSGHLIRLDTSTGEATITDGESLQQLLPPNDRSSAQILSSSELSKVTGNGGCSLDRFAGRLYNGTGVVLRSVGITITHKKLFSDEVVWVRQFVVRDLYLRPSEVRSFVVPLTGLEGQKCEWSVTHAYGSTWKPDANWLERLLQ